MHRFNRWFDRHEGKINAVAVFFVLLLIMVVW